MEGGSAVKVSDREMWGAVESADGQWILYEQPYRSWEVRGDSLMFLRSLPEPGFFRLSLTPAAHRPAELVAPAPKRLLLGPAAMSFSPNGKTILYTSLDLTIGDVYTLTPQAAR